MASEFVLGSLQLFAQGLRLVDHIGVVLVHLVEKIPILGELFERGGTQDEIDEARGSVAVHVAGTRAQLVLQIADLAVSVVDFGLLILHRLLRGFALVEGGAVSSYIHGGGKIGVLVQFDVEGIDPASDGFKQYGRDVAMQVAAAAPVAATREAVDPAVVEHEKAI